jgi:protein-tyrosine phosphatase
MAPKSKKSILFLCTGNYFRSRFAEVFFNSVVGKMGLPWRALSRGLALERGINNVGPMAAAALEALTAQGIAVTPECARLPEAVVIADLEQADRIIALQQAEHLPLVQERFPDWLDKVEYWHIHDAPGILPQIEAEVMNLVAQLLGGGSRTTGSAAEPVTAVCPCCRQALAACVCPKKKETAKPAPAVKVGLETKGRRGKGVTTITCLPLDEPGLQGLAAQLKQKCGTGGTVKDGRIEIQGDHRERLIAELAARGYNAKRAGG